eukprot:NODE_1085_length_1019_cov_105.554933_g1040_i0.p1 GENE.NODE_1085_length_1019_cov_105.554933_g1040_i0~~NODE_1085_length_1019_cov_105.554933_g1040_i0.p1  ORF type:complete len:227 (+),score=25.94 NODE_1085_length_1019_cov_105.554933_g1040_i0:81-761(+)
MVKPLRIGTAPVDEPIRCYWFVCNPTTGEFYQVRSEPWKPLGYLYIELVTLNVENLGPGATIDIQEDALFEFYAQSATTADIKVLGGCNVEHRSVYSLGPFNFSPIHRLCHARLLTSRRTGDAETYHLLQVDDNWMMLQERASLRFLQSADTNTHIDLTYDVRDSLWSVFMYDPVRESSRISFQALSRKETKKPKKSQRGSLQEPQENRFALRRRFLSALSAYTIS